MASTSSAASQFLRRIATRDSSDSIDLDGQTRSFTLGQLCDFILKHPSLDSARINMCCSYLQRSALFIPHRFLILRLQRTGRRDVWLRLDRRRSAEVGLAAFSSELGVTRANDTVSNDFDGSSRIPDTNLSPRR